MLESCCILKSPAKREGLERISIMSRHTHNDGKTPNELITLQRFDRHEPDLGPPGKLVGAYYRKEIGFKDYESQYKERLLKKMRDEITDIIIKATKEDVMVMCIEEDPTFCHRKIFVETAWEIAENIGIDLETRIF